MTIQDLFEPFEDDLQLQSTPRFPTLPIIEWRSAFGDFFFRIKGANPQILWCDLGYTVTPKRPLPPARQTTLTKRVSRAFAGRTFFRVVPFADSDEWALVRPKRALVKSPHQPNGAWWEWNAKFPTWGKTQMQWLSQDSDWFKRWLNDQQSKHESLRSAREVARLSDEERKWAPVIAPVEVRQQWEQLARALQLLTVAPNQSPHQWEIAGKQVQRKVLCLSIDANPYFQNQLPKCILSAALKLRDELTARFAIPVDFSRWRGIEPNGDQQFYVFPLFDLSMDSIHEKMEAALLWRDFLAGSSRRTELEAALNELMQ
ncbi:hypothetical protein IAD21_02345 [Abditibacteriota bacterium]|nr:hypothetical protein IAD21_02345 [Abditibacteriota bacterium]